MPTQYYGRPGVPGSTIPPNQGNPGGGGGGSNPGGSGGSNPGGGGGGGGVTQYYDRPRVHARASQLDETSADGFGGSTLQPNLLKFPAPARGAWASGYGIASRCDDGVVATTGGPMPVIVEPESPMIVRPEGRPWNRGPPGGGQLRGSICVSFLGVCRTAASGLRWRFCVFLPSAAQGGSVGIRIAYSACFKTLPHVLTYTVQYWVVFINMFHTAHPICGMGQCNGPVFATCRLRNLSAGASEDAGVLENVTYLLVAPDMWHG